MFREGQNQDLVQHFRTSSRQCLAGRRGDLIGIMGTERCPEFLKCNYKLPSLFTYHRALIKSTNIEALEYAKNCSRW